MMLPRNFESTKASAPVATGPTSAAGKQTVSKNAMVHGLAGRAHAALPGEEEPFAQHCRAMVEALAPAGPIEQAIAQDIAKNYWRLTRAHGMENALFNRIEREGSAASDPYAALAEAWCDPSQGLQRVALYANRIQRTIEKNTARLEALQSTRKAAHAQLQAEAVLLTQLAEANGETYDPAPDFPPPTVEKAAAGEFVYSAPEIARLIARASRLEDAKILFAPAAPAQPPDAIRKAASKAA
jgi:hypothetical protein